MLQLVLALIIQLSFAQDQSTCTGPIGNIVTCDQEIKEFKCDGPQADICGGTIININKPIKDFYIKAEDDNIAMNTEINVLFDNPIPPAEPITSIEGVLAGGDESLLGSTVTITNNQIDTKLTVKALEFNGDFSGDKFTLIMEDGPGSGGVELTKTVCGDSGLACFLKSSAISDAVTGATPNCKIITVAVDGTQAEYGCFTVFAEQLTVSTAAVPVVLPVLARSNLESELENDLESVNDNDENVEERHVTINFSEETMINLWGMISAFILLNIGAYCCYKRCGSNKYKASERVFVDQV